jgi:hypothetical protein
MPRIIATTLSIALLAGCNNAGTGPDANSQSQAGATTAGGPDATGQSQAAPSAADDPGMTVWLQGNGLPPVGDYQLTSADGAAIGKVTVDDAYRGIAWNEEQKLCFAAQHHPVGAGCYTVTKRARDGFTATNDKGAEVKFSPIAK